MSATGAGIATALADIGRRIDQACARAGREPASVRLIAVSKMQSAARVRAAFDCGQPLFGENRVQEALGKAEQVGPGPVWHLIGTLQRNKARHAVGLFELIHAVDGEGLARELDRRAQAAGVRQALLLQVNLAREATKGGVAEEELWPLVEQVVGLGHLELRGLMTVPPPVARAEDSRRWFARLRELRDEVSRRGGLPLPELSMGMTDDFEVAIEEGSTLVRVGRAIFGERE